MTTLLRRLLRRDTPRLQLVGYALAAFTGFAILMCALQLWLDTRRTADTDSEYITLSKRVTGLGGLAGDRQHFTAAELDTLARQPWVADWAPYTAARFPVFGTVETGGRRLSSAMFLEAVPDRFLDPMPPAWDTWQRDSVLPVVLPRDYLALYNYGFAASTGMPQLSEQMLQLVPLTLYYAGHTMTARVAGFSSRLNTIAVPENFLTAANAQYGGGAGEVTRVIVRVRPGDNNAARRYIEARGWQPGGDAASLQRTAGMLNILTAIVMAIGLVITLLAFFILVLSTLLMLQKNEATLHRLMLIGYAPQQLAAVYLRGVAALNAMVIGAALVVTLVARHLWAVPLRELGLAAASPWCIVVAALVLWAAVTAAGGWAIRRRVRASFRR